MGIFGNAFGWPHLLILVLIIVLLFGAAKLPALAKSLGQSARVFRGEMKALKDDEKKDAAASATSESTEAPGSTPASPSSTNSSSTTS
ncbi:MAG: twin-arginine translocase TatA/TatE family subunit [Microbacterium sp.]|jgi:sec-independent protein translocase protein TatA|uniref:Sec-independent protein translocase protein TatA n=1 Tax=Microbacterium ginsengisoli TaxID=400772 RepID=A0A0F0LWN4_9MICO|nr:MULTISPECIES: twin-arginine translocase TatA/TatE family subunit [Microbacterium]MAL07440.1 twin-arginine translocase TatA/TatE family subunit [Microbacterium sp.]MCK9914223.1 twin-arginine translocase TatA/TatE family subunit [Microbacteriaceae bacterium K1510]KJL35801.1 Sec-independent protein translocase protein TatA [Microbacterium ginsengisoli]KQR93168.1 preprotein translocase subunit TatA [Microbacterium sp. Leaf351]KQS05437.1 preprotein translocase subunit TatA [Microbacterium sp. Le